MNKNKFLLTFFILQALTFVMCLFIQIGQLKLTSIWFSLAVFNIGIYSLVYSLMYKLDSCAYLGTLLVAFGFATAYRFFGGYTFLDILPVYLLCFALAHMSIFIIFRQNIHFKLFAIIIFEAILLTSNKLQLVPAWLFWLINGIFLFALLIMIFLRARKNFKEN